MAPSPGVGDAVEVVASNGKQQRFPATGWEVDEGLLLVYSGSTNVATYASGEWSRVELRQAPAVADDVGPWQHARDIPFGVAVLDNEGDDWTPRQIAAEINEDGGETMDRWSPFTRTAE